MGFMSDYLKEMSDDAEMSDYAWEMSGDSEAMLHPVAII
jgi:hypothetical protein